MPSFNITLTLTVESKEVDTAAAAAVASLVSRRLVKAREKLVFGLENLTITRMLTPQEQRAQMGMYDPVAENPELAAQVEKLKKELSALQARVELREIPSEKSETRREVRLDDEEVIPEDPYGGRYRVD